MPEVIAEESRAPEPRAGALLPSPLEGRAWVGLRFAVDLGMLAIACLSAMTLGTRVSSEWLLVLFPPLTIVLMHSRGRYQQRLRDVALDSVASGFGAISLGTMALFALLALVAGNQASLGALIARLWLASVIGVTVAGLVITTIQYVLRRRGLIAVPTLIIGTDVTAIGIAERIALHAEYGLLVIGFLDAPTRPVPPGLPPLMGGLDEFSAVATAYGVRHVIVCFPDAADSEVLSLIAAGGERGIEAAVVPRLLSSVSHQTRFEYLGTTPLLNLHGVDLGGRPFTIKHALDWIVAAILLVLSSPLLLVVAALIKVSSPGPILFRQRRVGHDGREFTLLKFRTMLDFDPRSATFTPPIGLAPGGVEGADRRTAVGRLFRRTAIDELPQLINVIRGEMSLVGPRPERPEFAEAFRAYIERYHDRHRVRSGITGWAQVNGYRGQTSLVERVEFDNFYIEHWSLTLDLKILLLTIPAVLKTIFGGEASPDPEPTISADSSAR